MPPVKPTLYTDRMNVRDIESITDPVARFMAVRKALEEDIPAIESDLRAIRQSAIAELRGKGWSHAQIAEAFDISRTRAQQLAKGPIETEHSAT